MPQALFLGLDDLLRVALAFMRSQGGDIVACEPKEARSSNQAIRMADSLATTEGLFGAIAFSRTGDPALGDFDDAVILSKRSSGATRLTA